MTDKGQIMKKNMLRILTALTFFIISATQTYAQTGGTTRYVYDDNGRLHIVIASNGEAAIYTWDPAGNPISITRSNDPNATVRITSFTPGNGAPGTTVTINGTGFSSTAGQNIVRFNGVAAVVNSATTTQIVTSVPVRATSGPLTVTTPAGSAISPVTFIIPLSISGFAPKIGTPGTSVSITGNSFELNPSDNRVRFHQTPSVVSYATFTNLVTSVPAGATSGRISITTPFETFVSSDDFFVPPVPYTAADVSATARMTIGTSKIVGLEAPKIGLIVFDGVAGQRIGLQTVTSIEDSLLSVYKPDGTLLVPPRGIAFVLNVGFQSVLEPQELPVTGTCRI